MPGEKKAFKRLALVLSRLVLARETILRHAQSSLHAPELLELPAHASALDLWLAVLRRAKTEATVVPLVEAVLEENPAADTLRSALQTWVEAHAAEVAAGEPDVSSVGGRAVAAHAAPWIAGVVVIACAALAVVWLYIRKSEALSEPPHDVAQIQALIPEARSTVEAKELPAPSVEPSEPPPRAAAPRALPASEPTEAELEAALLKCWRATEGGDPDRPASSLQMVLLDKGSEHSFIDRKSPAFQDSPHFRCCALGVSNRFWERMANGASLRVEMLLPGKRVTAPFPTEARARAELLQCWKREEGGAVGTPAGALTFAVYAQGGQFMLRAQAPRFEACARALAQEYRRRATLLDELKAFTLELPPGPTA